MICNFDGQHTANNDLVFFSTQ